MTQHERPTSWPAPRSVRLSCGASAIYYKVSRTEKRPTFIVELQPESRIERHRSGTPVKPCKVFYFHLGLSHIHSVPQECFPPPSVCLTYAPLSLRSRYGLRSLRLPLDCLPGSITRGKWPRQQSLSRYICSCPCPGCATYSLYTHS